MDCYQIKLLLPCVFSKSSCCWKEVGWKGLGQDHNCWEPHCSLKLSEMCSGPVLALKSSPSFLRNWGVLSWCFLINHNLKLSWEWWGSGKLARLQNELDLR